MSIKSQSIGALFLALVVILALSPKIVNNIYENMLGRIFLICVVIFFSINSATLGLLLVLAIITALNQFGSFTEGFEQNEGAEQQQVLSKVVNIKQKISDLKAEKAEKEEETNGVNLQDLRDTTMAKNSNTIQVDKNIYSSEEVSPSTTSMLNSSLKENFTSINSY